jgi:hypothetical protein
VVLYESNFKGDIMESIEICDFYVESFIEVYKKLEKTNSNTVVVRDCYNKKSDNKLSSYHILVNEEKISVKREGAEIY